MVCFVLFLDARRYFWLIHVKNEGNDSLHQWPPKTGSAFSSGGHRGRQDELEKNIRFVITTSVLEDRLGSPSGINLGYDQGHAKIVKAVGNHLACL